MILPYDINDLTQDLLSSGFTFPFMFNIQPQMLAATDLNIRNYPGVRFSGSTASQWYESGGFVTGYTNDKLNEVQAYDVNNPYIVGFDIDSETYINYINSTILGVTRVTDVSDGIEYAIDANNDLFIGTDGQTTGIKYRTVDDEFYEIQNFDGDIELLPKTEMRFVSEGWNATNSTLNAYIRKDYMMGIVFPPETQSDLFIDRDSISVYDNHLKLGEIRDLEGLVDYGNGFFNFS